ncbi:MAG: 3-oxoacyl-ACP reductase [Acidobacteria bacterium]|nr:3-oxoacyl-ACP reductase [Acidobacteriota bacterium]|tara:strand:+ start:289 stop:1074 length:786 start_codon:yes stop_codon:yes gene_type:complete
MDYGLKGKNALVFGAGGGLGGAIAEALAAEGVCLFAADINEDALSAVTGRIRAAGGEAHALVWDIADKNALERHAEAIDASHGGVDILVNNTGGPPPTTAAGVNRDEWMRYFGSMACSVFAVTDRFLSGMRARKFGRIITSTSSGVVAPIPNLGISNAVRMSLVGWSKTLSREVARDGVTANIILPGRIATARIRQLDAAKAKREDRTVAEVEAESTGSIPVGRYGDPAEYGAAAAFLASRQAGYITGSTIRVDGGLIASI